MLSKDFPGFTKTKKPQAPRPGSLGDKTAQGFFSKTPMAQFTRGGDKNFFCHPNLVRKSPAEGQDSFFQPVTPDRPRTMVTNRVYAPRTSPVGRGIRGFISTKARRQFCPGRRSSATWRAPSYSRWCRASCWNTGTRVLVNPTGNFVIGGPLGDSGLTGRKIIVDTYGGVARHGGGAFSGKDPTKVDRSGAYAARYVAKNVVAAGLADRFEVQLAYAIGVAKPISISCETFGTATVDEDLIVRLIDQHFDLRPGAIIRDLRLRRPIYEKTAAYGHFGRTDIDAPWEQTDKAAALRAAAGLAPQRELVGAGA